MAPPFLVRPYDETDRNDLIQLWRDCGLVVPWNDPGADINQFLRSPCAEILIGEWEEKLVASGCIGHDGHRGWIYYLATAPSARNQGFARQILDLAEGWFRQQRIPKYQLLVREGNTPAMDYYEKLGFERSPVVTFSKWLT